MVWCQWIMNVQNAWSISVKHHTGWHFWCRLHSLLAIFNVFIIHSFGLIRDHSSFCGRRNSFSIFIFLSWVAAKAWQGDSSNGEGCGFDFHQRQHRSVLCKRRLGVLPCKGWGDTRQSIGSTVYDTIVSSRSTGTTSYPLSYISSNYELPIELHQ